MRSPTFTPGRLLFVTTGSMRAGKKRWHKKTHLPKNKENKEESVSLDTDRNTGDVNDAVNVLGGKSHFPGLLK